MGTPQVLDALDDAVQAAESAGQYFGKLEVSAQFIVLKKGERKRVWLEGESTDGRVSEVTLRLNPHDISGMTRLVERQCLANNGEWSRIVWPSLRDLGFKSLRDINGKWGHIAMVENGESYVNKDGVTVKKTTFKFLGVYDLESDLIKAYEAVHGSQPASNGAAPASTVSQDTGDDKALALQFLPAIVKASNGDPATLAQNIAGMPLLAKHFTVNSPEVQQLLKAA